MRSFLTHCAEKAHKHLRAGCDTLLIQLVQWNEFYLAVVLVMLWPVVQFVLRLIDPTAYPLDAGVLHSDYYAALKFAVFYGFVWVGIKLNQPLIFKFFEKDFTPELFNELTPWQRVKISYCALALHLAFASVCLLAARV